MISIEIILLVAAVLLLLSVSVSKISDRLGIPVLLLFLSIGMLAGSEGIGRIYFDDPWITKSLGTVALIFILFAGGFDTKWQDVRPILWRGLSLSTLGVLLTALAVGFFATNVLNFSLMEGLLLGAIVSSTDAAAVFNVLRSNNVSLRGRLQPLLEFESGSNDPMAVFLTVGIIGLIQNPEASPLQLIPDFFLEMGIGIAAGWALSKFCIFVINRLKIAYEGLYPALTISLVLLIYSVTTILKGNGFLAVYLAGILIGNTNLIHRKTIKNFCDGTAWLMQIVMFLTLGLLVYPSKIIPIAGIGLLISLFLLFVARPLNVYICLFFTRMNIREKTFVAWVGLRGAIPIILATFPLLAEIPKAEMIFNIVFFIVITSVLLQGTTLPLVSRLLKVDAPFRNKKNYPIEFEHSGEINASLEEIIVPYGSKAVGKSLVEIGTPQECLIVLISRNEKFFIPNGGTILIEGDVLLALTNEKALKELYTYFNQPETI